VLKLMQRHRIRRLPVLRQRRLVGMISEAVRLMLYGCGDFVDDYEASAGTRPAGGRNARPAMDVTAGGAAPEIPSSIRSGPLLNNKSLLAVAIHQPHMTISAQRSQQQPVGRDRVHGSKPEIGAGHDLRYRVAQDHRSRSTQRAPSGRPACTRARATSREAPPAAQL
jgi:hypothetical protein